MASGFFAIQDHSCICVCARARVCVCGGGGGSACERMCVCVCVCVCVRARGCQKKGVKHTYSTLELLGSGEVGLYKLLHKRCHGSFALNR